MNGPSPYKGLAPFEDSDLDARFFFGRGREQGIITANLTAARLTLLYGASGVGKSSILRAGVVRRLRALPGPLAVVVFDRWRDDPGERLRDTVAAAASREPAGSLADTLEAACARLGGEIYIILDGAEEYFVYHGVESEPGTFAADFPLAVTRPGLRAYFLLSLREDAVAALDRFKSGIPSLFANSLRLDHLDRSAAREAIVGPIEQYNLLTPNGPIEIEPELVEAVLDEVASGKVDLGLAGRGVANGGRAGEYVETPYLSLVMERLWEAEREEGSDVLRLRTLAALGGAAQIVRDHLEEALDALPPEGQKAAAEMFNHLVTPSGTKIAHRVSDLAEYAGIGETELEPTLHALTTERILRPVAATNGSSRYEIFHDVLANAVLAWRSGYAANRELELERRAGRKRVRRLFIVIAVAVVALAAMVAVAIFALAQRSDALRERSDARIQARHAVARELSASALSQLAVDPELSLLLGLEAAKREPSPAVEDVLRQALTASRVRAVMHAGGKPVRSIDFSPDGSRLALGGADGKVRVFAIGGKLLDVLGHAGPVTSVAYSRDGKLLVSASRDGTAHVWRTSDGATLKVLHDAGPVESATFSPNASLVATASDDRTARIWRADTGDLLHQLSHKRPVRSVLFNPDGHLLATVSGHEVRIYDVGTGELLRVLPHPGLVLSASFNVNGTSVATASADRAARVWDVRSGTLVRTFSDPPSGVVGAVFSPNATELVTAGTDGASRVWDVRTGGRIAVVGGHTNRVTSASFSPDGFWIVTSSRDRTARVFKAKTGRPWGVPLLGHEDAVNIALFSPSSELVATASGDGTARVWDPGTAPQLATIGMHHASVNRASFSPDGTLAVSASDDGTARIWRTKDGTPVAVLHHGDRVTDASFSRDGKLVVTASVDGTARIWTRTGRLLHTLHHDGAVRTAFFSGDGRLVVTSSADRTARIWRVADGAELHALHHSAPVVLASFSPDGRLVLTAAARAARIWRVADGAPLHVLHAYRGPIVDASFSPDGSKVVTASADWTARLWDARTGRMLHWLRGHHGPLTSAAFSADSKLLVTASRDHDARIWDVATGRKLRAPLSAHFGVVNAASFSPDGRWVVTAGPSAAGLWATATGVREAYLYGPNGPLHSAVFSPDGSRILTAGADGTVRIYRCDICGTLPALVALAERRLAGTGRELTSAERARYFHH